MPGIAELALGAAPIAGGALLGVAAGNLKPPDIRGNIAKDMDLLGRIPDDQPELRARLKDSIDRRIDSLIQADERSREIRIAAMSYRGNWRDIVVFVCAVLFTIVWWNVSHSRANRLEITRVVAVGSTRRLRGRAWRSVRRCWSSRSRRWRVAGRPRPSR